MATKEKTGIVVSNKMNKTITVLVESRYAHPIYGKTLKTSKRFMAHDESQECNLGDRVTAGSFIRSDIALGKQTSSSISYKYSYDTRISGLNPDAGVLLEFSQEFSGLGGNKKYTKTGAKAVGQRRVLQDEVVRYCSRCCCTYTTYSTT